VASKRKRRRKESPDLQTDLGLIRAAEICKLLTISESSWWRGVKSKKFPPPIRIGSQRLALWRIRDIKALVNDATPYTPAPAVHRKTFFERKGKSNEAREQSFITFL